VKVAPASECIRENYHPKDTLALVIKYQSGGLLQRITTAERIAAPNLQGWLQSQNNNAPARPIFR
jgi:hypothetical protein